MTVPLSRRHPKAPSSCSYNPINNNMIIDALDQRMDREICSDLGHLMSGTFDCGTQSCTNRQSCCSPPLPSLSQETGRLLSHPCPLSPVPCTIPISSLQFPGVAGIIRKAEEEERKTQSTVQEAFDNLNTLMNSARELVSIANRLQSNYSKTQPSEEEADEFHQYMLGLGLASPVSRNTVGNKGDFHAELSRQLCDFLQDPLSMNNGTLSLIDVYCLYNRARGSDLVSPDDVLKACNLFEPLGLPLSLKQFPSGVIVVQSAQLSLEQVQNICLSHLKLHPHISGLQLADRLNVPLLLATEYLLDAEKRGVLCRDESLQGLCFYLNFFNDCSKADAILHLMQHEQG